MRFIRLSNKRREEGGWSKVDGVVTTGLLSGFNPDPR
jgi:hypothetical protein